MPQGYMGYCKDILDVIGTLKDQVLHMVTNMITGVEYKYVKEEDEQMRILQQLIVFMLTGMFPEKEDLTYVGTCARERTANVESSQSCSSFLPFRGYCMWTLFIEANYDHSSTIRGKL